VTSGPNRAVLIAPVEAGATVRKANVAGRRLGLEQEWQILAALKLRPGQDSSALTADLALTFGALRNALSALARSGMIEEHEHESDRRRRR
jgi:DNA-binding MarR family transcriptional regulator